MLSYTPEYSQFIPLVKAQYFRAHGREPDLDKPLLFTEKIQWLKIHDSSFLKTLCADKIAAHEYVKKVFGEDKCVPILHQYDSPNDLSEHTIDKPSVLKCNHGSGMNIIIKKDATINVPEIREKFTKWLSIDHGSYFNEFHYSVIPHKIYAEKFLNNIRDVKLFCFNGTPRFFQIDRHFAEHRMNFYDLKWNPLSWLSRKDYPANYKIIDSKPPIDLLIEYASVLCKPFKFVRCDFVISDKKVYVGELTFTPGAGNQSYLGDGDKRLGDMLDLQ